MTTTDTAMESKPNPEKAMAVYIANLFGLPDDDWIHFVSAVDIGLALVRSRSRLMAQTQWRSDETARKLVELTMSESVDRLTTPAERG